MVARQQEYSITRMQPEYLNDIVTIHLLSFTGFFLTFLGGKFLFQLYKGVLADNSGIFIVAKNVDQVVGFVAGTDNPSGFYLRLLTHHWWRFGMACVLPILKNPFIIPRLLRAVRKSEEKNPFPDCCTLMSIAVLPEMQGKGIGQSLVRAFCKESRVRGQKYVNLTTDLMNNDSVNHFYTNLGFRCARTLTTPEGRKMNEYVIDLPLS